MKLNDVQIRTLLDLLKNKELDVRENFPVYSFTEKEADEYTEELGEISMILNDMLENFANN